MNQLEFSMKRLLKITVLLVRSEIMIDLQYRINFLFSFIGVYFWLFAELLFFNFLLNRYKAIAGWSFEQILLLVGINQMWVGGFFYLIIWPSLTTFANLIKGGGIDKILTYPVNTRFFLSVFKFDWTSITMFVQGLVLTIYALTKLSLNLSVSSVILALLLFLLSGWLVYSTQYMISCFMFWLINAGSIQYFFQAFDRFSRLPYEIMTSKFVFVIFTLLIPIALVSNLPARALLDVLDWQIVSWGIFSGIFLFILSHIVWRLGLKRYESASS